VKTKIAVFKKGVKQVRRHGLGLLYERFFRRKEIFSSPPIKCEPGSSLEVHMQVCDRDWLNSIWTLKSLRMACQKDFRLVMYLDSNVPSEAKEILRFHFQGAHFPEPDWLAEEVRQRLAPIAPALAALWRARYSVTLCKMANVWISAKQKRVLYLDPDVLFFARPDELLEFIASGNGGIVGLFNSTELPPDDLPDSGGFCLDEADVVQTLGIRLPRNFNAGLGALALDSLDWPVLEETFKKMRWLQDRALMFDQTCLALLAAKRGWVALDRARYLTNGAQFGSSSIAAHYSGSEWRDAFYAQGMPLVRERGLFHTKQV
jgi:hypothetical protein